MSFKRISVPKLNVFPFQREQNRHQFCLTRCILVGGMEFNPHLSIPKNKMMKTLRFKTNINCSNCLAKVTPFLDRKEGIHSWSVDTDNPDKILTVETEELEREDILKTIKRTGFEAEEI